MPNMPTTIDTAVLLERLDAATTKPELYSAIVNAPFDLKVEMALLFLGIIVLLLVDEKTGDIHRVSLSETDLAKGTVKMSAKPFEDITIPLSETHNVIAMAVRNQKSYVTTDWQYLFAPALTPTQARLNQAGGGIAYSCVFPLSAGAGGALIYSYFQFSGKVRSSQRKFMQAYTDIVDNRLKRQG